MLRTKLQEDQTASLKSGDKIKLEALRYILSRVKNLEIDKKRELTDEETVEVLRKIKGELSESIESFEKGGRSDLVAQNKEQLKIVTSYLPQEMTDEELRKAIEEIRSKNAQAIEANPKAFIGICIKELKGRVDTSRVVKLLQES